MLLVLDVGNTQTVIGLYAPEVANPKKTTKDLRAHWRIATNSERTADELALVLSQFLALENVNLKVDVKGIAVSSVVPRLTTTYEELATRYAPDAELVVLRAGIDVGMRALVDTPKEVGADRLANSVGAFDLYGGPSIVVDFGTATTFEVVSKEGDYLGGVILPGIEVSLEALFAKTAALRRVELVEPRNVIGKNTIEHIQSGAIYGFAAQVDGLTERIKNEIGEATVVATGGLAGLIQPHTKHITVLDPWLTLHGLRVVFERLIK